MGIKHATLTAVADDPAYDIGSDEWNADHTADTITIATGTITVSNPALNITQTWNAGAVTFTGLKLNVTNTASAAGSLLADWQVGSVSKFAISSAGKTTTDAGSNETVATFTNSAAQPWSVAVGNGNQFAAGWLAIGIGTSVSSSTYMVKFDPVYHVATFRVAVASPSYNSAITGRGDAPVMLWTNAGGNFNGTLTLGQDYTSGTSNLEAVVGPAAGSFTVRTNTPTVLFTVDSATNAATALFVGTTPIAVSALPTAAAGNKGYRGFVTDSNATMTAGIGAVVAGGGTYNVPVYSDGTNWLIG